MSEEDRPSQAKAAEPAPDAAPALPTPAECSAVLEEARRLFRSAELVQARRTGGGVESAVIAHRALTMVLQLLVRTHGSAVPETFPELAERASAIAKEEELLSEDLAPDLGVIAEMREKVFAGAETSNADDRRYDRAFLRSAEWFRAVQTYVRQRLPSSGRGSYGASVLLGVALLAFVGGTVVGRREAPRAVESVGAAVAAPSVEPGSPAFVGVYFRDTVFSEPVLTRRDPSIAFDWGSRPPVVSMLSDNFAVRWEGSLHIASPGKYTFYLTSDDGSRFFLDGTLVIDNWGSHAEHTEEGTVELAQGLHQLRVEYFDKVGSAMVRFEWSSEKIPRRLMVNTDLR